MSSHKKTLSKSCPDHTRQQKNKVLTGSKGYIPTAMGMRDSSANQRLSILKSVQFQSYFLLMFMTSVIADVMQVSMQMRKP